MHPNRAAAVGCFILFVMAVLASVAGAQSDDAPAVSGATSLLYAHNEDGSDEYAGWMNTLVEDGDDVAMGVANSCTLPIAVPGVDEGLDLTWSLTLSPALEAPVALEEGGMVNFVVHLGAGGGTGSDLSVSTTLTSGETVVAQGEAQEYSYEASDAEYGTVEWAVVPQVSTLEAGSDLVWTIHLEAPACSTTSGPFISVSPDRGLTRIELPAVGGGLPDAQPLEGETATVELTYDEPANETRAFEWAGPAGPLSAAAEATVEGGSSVITVADGNRSQPLELRLDENATEGQGTADGAAGNWSIQVELLDFVGTLRFTLGPASAQTPVGNDTADGGPLDAGNATAGNQTDGDAPDEGYLGIPGPGLLVVMLVVASAAVILRARRQP